MICFTFSSGFPVIFHLERWGIIRNMDRRKCSFTRLQMYQSRQSIGATTEYAVEKKFGRRARGRKGLSPPPSQTNGDESSSNAKRAIMGQSRAERKTLARSRMDGCARGCAARARPPACPRPKQSAFPPPSSSFLALRGTRNKDIAPSIERDRERERVR